MGQLKLILQSLNKQGFRIKLIVIQMLFVFIAFNMAFNLIYNSSKFERDIKKVFNPDDTMNLQIIITKSISESSVDYKNIYKDILNSKYVKNAGLYLSTDTSLGAMSDQAELKKTNLDIRKIYIDLPSAKLYRFKVQCGKSFSADDFKNMNNNDIPILVGKDLEKVLPVNSELDMKHQVDYHKVVYTKLKVIGILDASSIFWADNHASKNITGNLDNAVIIPFNGPNYDIDDFAMQYMIGTDMTIQCKDKLSRDKLMKYLTDKYGSSKCEFKFNTVNEMIRNTYKDNAVWLAIIFAFAAMLLILSGIGLTGTILTYIDTRRREFGIRFAMGSTSKSLVTLIFGEVCIIFLVSDICSIVIYAVISLILPEGIIPAFNLIPALYSLILALALSIITAIAPIINILKSEPVNLIRGL